MFVLIYRSLGVVEPIGSSVNDRFLIFAQVDKVELLWLIGFPKILR
jgi:hypothetical protein